MIFVRRTQLLDQDSAEFIVDDDVIKNVGNFESEIKTTGSTAVDGDGKF